MLDDPVTLSYDGQPVSVLRIRGEMIIVNFDSSTGFAKRAGNFVFAERTV